MHGPPRSSTWSAVNETRPAVTLSQTPLKSSPVRVFASPVDYHSFPPAPYSYQHGHEYPSPLSPEAEGRHINQKYTTEQGDYIIYAWHDKKMKWAAIKEEYASMFGKTPERTVQGLQAWYYRMNKEIPVWDDDGWLIFEHEDAVEPKCISIKRRQREVKCEPCTRAQGTQKLKKDQEGLWREEGCQCKQLGPLGLAERYPERLVHYNWVDNEFKRKARNWGKSRLLSNVASRHYTDDLFSHKTHHAIQRPPGEEKAEGDETRQAMNISQCGNPITTFPYSAASI